MHKRLLPSSFTFQILLIDVGIFFIRHIGLLKIHKKEFKLEKIRLQTVRPLFFEKVVLSQTNLNPGSEDELTEFLKEKV